MQAKLDKYIQSHILYNMKTTKKSHRPGRKRILFDMPNYIYQDMKKAADERGETITCYLLTAVARRLTQER